MTSGARRPDAASRVAVLTVSDRSAEGSRDDAAGPIAVSALREAGFACDDARVIPDGADGVEHALREMTDAGIRLIVTSGGASVGEHDLIRPALERWGATIAFWRVAMRPGKPLLVARKGAQWVIGLPGNPVSAFVTHLVHLRGGSVVVDHDAISVRTALLLLPFSHAGG